MWALKAVRRLPKSVQIEWEDGYLANFPYVWLRDNTLRRPSLLHVDLDLKPYVMDWNKDRLSVLWPICMASQYSSQFLRTYSIIRPGVDMDEPLPQSILPNTWKIVPATPCDPMVTMGTVEWGERARDLGNVWPHLERVPSLCTVDSLNGVSEVYVADAVQAFEEMSVRFPEEFDFLTRCSVEYRQGPFKARHKIVNTTCVDGKLQINSVILDNDSRSPEITVECLDKLYSNLKLFAVILTTNAHTVQLGPKDRLVVDNHRAMVGAPPKLGRRLLVRTFS